MESKVEFLKQSLLYQMSLGSKELYHSNVWAWLIENDPAFIKAFVPDFDDNTYEIVEHEPEYKHVLREYNHRDIIIWLHKKGSDEKCFYVIENKIKSLQSESQLKDYSENLGDYTMLGGVVTGIRNALNSEEILLKKNDDGKVNFKWKFVSYKDICQNIICILQTSTQPVIKNHKSQITEYCQIIDAIYNVIEEAMSENDKRLNYTYPSYLADLRLQDVFVKLKGSDFMKYVSDRKAELEALCPEGFGLRLNQSFHNRKATLDIRYTNLKKVGDDWIGIQLEQNQYRIVVYQSDSHDKQRIFDMYKCIWFDSEFDKSAHERMLFKKYPTAMKKEFDCYGEQFVYQYYNIDKDNNDYETIFNNIVEDLKRAEVVLKSVQ